MEKEKFDLLTAAMTREGYSATDIQYITTAYETSRRLHENRCQDPGLSALQCMHLIRTAHRLVELCLDANTIAAALMHDLLYNCDADEEELTKTFPGVVYYLKGMKQYHDEVTDYLNGKVTQSIQDLLKKPVDPHVVLISAAKRLDCLESFGDLREEDRSAYLEHTDEVLKKLVEKEGSLYLADLLSDSWQRCRESLKEPDIYRIYQEKYKTLLRTNELSAEETLSFLYDTFTMQRADLPPGMSDCIKGVKFIHMERQICNILKHLPADETSGRSPVNTRPFSKRDVPLYDITLIFEDSEKDVHVLTDHFLYVFQHYLRRYSFTVRDYLITKDRIPYFVLADRWENRYRIFLRTRHMYRRFQTGTIAEEEYSLLNRGRVRITVGAGKDTYYLQAGLSSLEYALTICREEGLKFKKMLINNTISDTTGDMKLENGDFGHLFLADGITADLSWFNYVESEIVRNLLISYFKNSFREKNNVPAHASDTL